ncbi:gluconate 2-dehydrogenase subunit 3 family protein [Novosphingobium piscinae]|uniref:Gluconate 2-dehydrogenase subunit 3 family protein n=1 Tax=Novosphingobium piscinae TaxID=1507448 RepID=A0A7X1KQW2_9SPHN|nr:gluconate 2-dehydrogenase subunit 3 family protein [Novosphingobium piscinae]MBC2670107.1 gluconate 2-dehydrogenase subunit 3 family protein [Novosphingobium piscinae]
MLELDRRNLLAVVAGLIGAAALPSGALAAAATPARAGLDPATRALVTAVADTLIPRTDTPGARDAGVPAVFAALMRDWASAERRATCLGALQAIDTAAQTTAGQPFARLSPARRTAVLTAHDAARLGSDAGYTMTKELLVALYYLSEPGATRELRYEHAPGAWEASIPLTAQTRAWAGA